MKRISARGHATVEYALTGMLLISMVAISSLIGLGTNISSNFSLVGNAVETATGQSGTALKFSTITTIGGGTGNSPMNPSSLGKLADSIVQQGLAYTTVTAPDTSSTNSATVKNTSQMIMVSGANGATNYLASTLTQRTDAMLAAGTITQEQANQIYKLANAGHDLANSQALLEKALEAGKTTITVGNKTYSQDEYAGLLGFKGSTKAEQNWNVDPSAANKFLQPFAQQYALLKESPVMQNPEVAQQVNGLVMQIGALSDAISWSYNMGTGGSVIQPSDLAAFENVASAHFQDNMQDAPTSSVSQVATTGVSSLTNMNSAGICKTGSGTDSGSSCTP